MAYRILIPLDGSGFAEQALQAVRAMAGTVHLEIELLHVLDYQHLLPEPQASDDAWLHQTLRDDAQSYLDRLAGELKSSTAVLSAHVVEGEPVTRIQEESARGAFDLIVMSTHGHGALDRAWLGSVADALVRESHIPVLLIRAGEDGALTRAPVRFQHVLLPLDGSPLAEQMIEPALRFARLNEARVSLLQVVHPWVRTTRPMASAHQAAELRSAAIEARRQEAATYLQGLAGRLQGRASGLHAEVVVAEATDAAEVIEYAEQHDVDVIALATRGRSGWKRFALGSVADKLIRGASTPVLVVSPKGND